MIKESPEDFIVEEIPTFVLKDSGDYTIFKLTKRLLTTEDAISIISKRFNLIRKNIKYAGMKDKHASTTQYISIFRGSSGIKVEGKDLNLEFVGYSDEPLSLGSLAGNKFTIIVRDVDKEPNKINVMPNYFDEQRFSTNNFNIGICILKSDFKGACEILADDWPQLKYHLDSNPNDYVNAFKLVPKKISSMYLHSVQSLIFNNALADMIKFSGEDFKELKYSDGTFIFCKGYEGLPDELEMVGFDTITTNENINSQLKNHGIVPRDFIVRQIPDLSVEGAMRKCVVSLQDYSCERIDEKTLRLKFTLTKGSYATIAVKALFA